MINKDTFIKIAMSAYIKPSCKTIEEFESDILRFSHLVRICAREPGEIETRLLLNQVMVLFNLFEQHECIKMMFFKVQKKDWVKLKTILEYLNRMPAYIHDMDLHTTEITICQNTLNILETI